MKVGLTYDLREDYLNNGFSLEETAEFDKIETIEAIEQSLQKLGHEPERIGHSQSLMQKLSSGQRWDLVFNIAEGMYGLGREALIPCLLDSYQIPYTFSNPAVLSVCLHKGLTKRIVQNLNVPTADFTVVHDQKELEAVTLAPYPLFIKPVSEGTGKGISEQSIIQNKEQLLTHGSYLLKTFRQPILVETYLPGDEYTVGIVGSGEDAKVVGIMSVIFTDKAHGKIYSYKNKAEYEDRVNYKSLEDVALYKQIEQVCLKAWRGLGCVDAGRIDVRLNAEGVPCFIEVNPLAGLHPVDSDLVILSRLQGLDYSYLIEQIVNSALKRQKSQLYEHSCIA